jgi:glycosyltransferase involved in cell wall biosynthesis
VRTPRELVDAVAYRARRAGLRRRPSLAKAGERRDVLLVSGPIGGARRYRGDNRREQLSASGLSADVCYRTDVELAQVAPRYGCIVLYRVPWDDGVERLLASAPAAGCTVIADFDDLVFDPDRADLLRALGSLADADRKAYIAELAALHRTLEACVGATVSTDPLAEAASAVSSRVAVLYNVVGAEQLRGAKAALAARGRRDPMFRVGYLSGTPTHQRDFMEAADALIWALDRYPEVELVIAGFLELDKRFDEFGPRVVREPYRATNKLPALIATLDVNLAPLERGSDFTDSKSCIKFLEAGLLAVPTIASRRPDFVRVIEHGANGLLADDANEWRDALARLVENRELGPQLGEHARGDVLGSHTAHASAVHARTALEALVPGLSEPSAR